MFVNLTNRSVAAGRQVANMPRPELFNSETDRDGVAQHLRVDFRVDGVPSGRVTPPPKEPVTPVSFSQLAGTVDNLTAYFR